MANSVDPDQTPRSAASDLGLRSLLRPVYCNSSDKHGISNWSFLSNFMNLHGPFMTEKSNDAVMVCKKIPISFTTILHTYSQANYI